MTNELYQTDEAKPRVKPVSELSIQYTHFPHYKIPQGKLVRTTWVDFCNMVANAPSHPDKYTQPLLRLAVFEGDSRAKGKALLTATGVEVDYDNGTMSMTEAARILQKAGITALLYPSYSATLDSHRWRVLAPLAVAVSAEERTRWVWVLDRMLGGIVAPESYTPKQPYFYGRNPDQPYLTIITDGQCIDVLPACQQIADEFLTQQEQKRQAVETKALEHKQPDTPRLDSGQINIIETFNDTYDVTSILVSHGYHQQGDRFVYSESETGTAGVVLLDDGNKCYSHHGSDPLADQHAHNTFNTFRILDCGGDFRLALHKAGQMLCAPNGQNVTIYNHKKYLAGKRQQRLERLKDLLPAMKHSMNVQQQAATHHRQTILNARRSTL